MEERIYMEEKLYDFWLCNLPGIGFYKRKQLLAYFGAAREVFYGAEGHFQKIPALRDKDRETILAGRTEKQVEEEYKKMKQKDIHFFSMDDQEFPEKLRHVAQPPRGIFVRGSLPDTKRVSVAIVGARNASYEGRALAEKFGCELATRGIQIISGLARGVDIAAQQGALQPSVGTTFSILGTGVDICYPGEHMGFYETISKRGGVISEFPLGTPPFPYHFPMRNRIISGLSDGIVIIEARKGSGSLITAEHGLEQGKEIFVVPGSVTDIQYQGGNELLKNGAVLVTNVRDILDGLGIFLEDKKTEQKKKSDVLLETAEKIVYANLRLKPVSVAYIVEMTELEPKKVMDILFSLERKNLVKAVGNNYYALKL